MPAFLFREFKPALSAYDAVDGSPPSCGSIVGLSWKESRDGRSCYDRSGYREVGVPGAWRWSRWRGADPPPADAREDAAFFREAAALSRRHRGVQQLALLGARADCARPRREADAGAVCEALCQSVGRTTLPMRKRSARR